jgi:hypothetical protein
MDSNNLTSNTCVISKPFVYQGKYNEIYGKEQLNENIIKVEKINSSNSNPNSTNSKTINYTKYGNLFGRCDDDMPESGYRMCARLDNPDI